MFKVIFIAFLIDFQSIQSCRYLKKTIFDAEELHFLYFPPFPCTCIFGSLFLLKFHFRGAFFHQKSKKNRNGERFKKSSIFQYIFSSILVDFGLHFGTPEFRDSLIWATMAALGSCLALSWVIFAASIRFLTPLGSIFGRFSNDLGIHFLIF